MTDVYCRAPKAPSLTNDDMMRPNSFQLTTITYQNKGVTTITSGYNATLHILDDTQGYQGSEWRYFRNIVKGMPMPKFWLKYVVDGEEYSKIEVEYGKTTSSVIGPVKEGYSFVASSERPETMPGHDVTVTGSFSINKYNLTYKVDGHVYKTYELEYGTEIIIEKEPPAKENYTFSGWKRSGLGNIPSTMPGKDVVITGKYVPNKFFVTYMVNDEIFVVSEVEYGAMIAPEEYPEEEGYTFSGWSEMPEIMPAHDITVAGYFTINKYKLAYMVDGMEYKTVEMEYGKEITVELEPTKDGYTFSGWDLFYKNMPSKNVIVTGSFSINTYKLIYKVDDEEYKTLEIEYGSVIDPEAEPTKEGYTFSGWSLIPETMPANDVTITGSFTMIDDVQDINADEGEYQIYTLDGKQVDTLQKGVNIIRHSNGSTQKVFVK